MEVSPRIWWSSEEKAVKHNSGYYACLKVLADNTPLHWKVIRDVGQQFVEGSPNVFMRIPQILTDVYTLYNLVQMLQVSLKPRCSTCKQTYGKLLVYVEEEHVMNQIFDALSVSDFNLVQSHIDDCRWILKESMPCEHCVQ